MHESEKIMLEEQLVTLSEMAEVLNVSEKHITYMVNQGVLIRERRNQYPVFENMKAYVRRIRGNKAVTVGHNPNAEEADYGAERARLTKAKADMAVMQKEEMEGKLIRADDVEQALIQAVSNMKTKLLNLPTKAAPDAFSAENLADAKNSLKVHVYQALEELANVQVFLDDQRSSHAPLGDSEGDEGSDASAGSDDL
jgi:phage terminase Nu1 subunit (DNA packaging protein)